MPSARTRWCTRQLKLLPFRQWTRQWLEKGEKVVSFVAIRADEDHREGYTSTHEMLTIEMPFRAAGIDRQRVLEILNSSGGRVSPQYYDWRSRSGCTFCFFQQKIEWVRLKEVHPDKFAEAKAYEKTALSHGSPFTWSQGESLDELELPSRMEQIKVEFEERRKRAQSLRRSNPLRVLQAADIESVDEIYDFGRRSRCLSYMPQINVRAKQSRESSIPTDYRLKRGCVWHSALSACASTV